MNAASKPTYDELLSRNNLLEKSLALSNENYLLLERNYSVADKNYSKLNENYSHLSENYLQLENKYKVLFDRCEDLQQKNYNIQFELFKLKRMVFGSKSERFTGVENPLQSKLEFELEALGNKIIETTTINAHTRNKVNIQPRQHKGRNGFPDHLRRETTMILPEGGTKDLDHIGEEVTEILEYNEGELYVKQIVRPKYARRDGEGMVTAPLPPRVLEKSQFGNSFAAHIAVSKFVDHLPEYRQIGMFKRQGIYLSSSSINDLTNNIGRALIPTYEVHKASVLSCNYLQMDETTNRVLTNNKPGKTHQGYYWVCRSPVNNSVLFEYRPGRGRAGPRDTLRSFQGFLQTDAYSAYDEFGLHPGIILFHCWAHARRNFVDALSNDKPTASKMLEMIQELYAVERIAREKNMSYDERYALRQEASIPILAKIYEWLKDKILTITLPKSPIAKAIAYVFTRWEKFCIYTTNGMLEIDNNLVENSIRPVTLGRKNYLFAGSEEAAQNAAIYYSFFGTCKLRDKNPSKWLIETLDELPLTKPEDLYKLLP